MPDIDTVRDWQGRAMVDRDGAKLGMIDAIYLDDDTGQPEWATVTTGLFGTRTTFVPLAQARAMGDSVQVPYQKDQVKDAPSMEAEAQLSQDEEAELYRHYGLNYTESRSDSGLPAGTTGQDIDPRDRDRDAGEGARLRGAECPRRIEQRRIERLEPGDRLADVERAGDEGQRDDDARGLEGQAYAGLVQGAAQ
jgi:hypothetical protein